MFRFALKNLATKKITALLLMFSILLSAGVALLAYNTARQTSEGITGNAAYYSLIIGPAGSETQLAMNSMYFTDSPLGTIPYSLCQTLAMDSRTSEVVPFAMADSYNGYSCVGTTRAYLDGKNLAEGQMFSSDGSLEVVVGSAVAETCGLSVGDSIFTSHSAGEEHHTPLTVTGILEETHTVFDKTVFTQLKTIWELHESEEEEEEEEEEHDHEEMSGMVCAILLKTKNPAQAMQMVTEYSDRVITDEEGNSYTLQAVEPMAAVRSVLEDADNTRYIVYVLSGVILLMNILVISIITALNMVNSRREISLMRFIGISMKNINAMYAIQNGLIGLLACLLAFGVSRLAMLGMESYVEQMGVLLNPGKFYPAEGAILLLVWLITVLPSVFAILRMGRKGGMNS